MKKLNALLFMVAAMPAFGRTIGGVMPWEQPIANVADSLTGPTAAGVALIALAAAMYELVFGNHFGEMGRKLTLLTFCIALLMLAATFLRGIGVSGAMV